MLLQDLVRTHGGSVDRPYIKPIMHYIQGHPSRVSRIWFMSSIICADLNYT